MEYNMEYNMEHLLKGKWTAAFEPGLAGLRNVLSGLLSAQSPGQASFNLQEEFKDFKFENKFKKISLCTPVRMNDKRWETINLTTASLYLGSALTDSGFDVVTDKLTVPAAVMPPGLLSRDVLGFTLFEDMMDVFMDVPGKLRTNHGFGGLLAAGGPMVTLNPLQSAWHLPEINLLIRGEAETVLPGILEALNDGDMRRLLSFQGFLLHWRGQLLISDLGIINRPEDFKEFSFSLDFLEPKHLEQGLELNLSRGCRRGCIFCSAVQGKCFRSLPESSLETLLNSVNGKLDTFKLTAQTSPHARSVNINDDDILQDPDYAGRVFSRIKESGFRLWGVQTSLDSFLNSRRKLAREVVELVSDRELYMDDNPLIWLGTDAFLKERGRKLAKLIPDEHGLTELIEAFEEHRIRNYHYWISSDHYSDWPELVREFTLIYRLLKNYTYFGLIAHSPFLVPYSTTPLYRLLSKSEELKSRIKYKQILEAGNKEFNFPLVERVETAYPHLNRLLNNAEPAGGKGFFHYLKQKDYTAALMTMYGFLKQERMDAESSANWGNPDLAARLRQNEAELEEFISSIL